MKKLLELIFSRTTQDWNLRCNEAYNELFDATNGRYSEKAKKVVMLRAPKISPEMGVPFAAFIHPSNPESGAYGGMCFVIFPVENAPCLIAMGIGTQGLSPDEEILGRPGHGRKVNAICSWINSKYGDGKMIAWAKQDPARTDLDVPMNIKKNFDAYKSVFERYGRVLYGIYSPKADDEASKDLLKAFLDLMFEERGHDTRSNFKGDSGTIRSEYFEYLFPQKPQSEIVNLLQKRQFVILEGPPGTGKTRLANEILEKNYNSNGVSIQFHPNTTYETFIGGLFPEKTKGEFGFQFSPKKGDLIEAVICAINNPTKNYLLHIDEINRADLAKVLGEAIYLFEPKVDKLREVKLSYNFDEPIYNKLVIPRNLHIIGTMNTADRSIAIVDIAIRRRFAFIKLWPQTRIVNEIACDLMKDAFEKTISIFIEHASDDAFNLVPGHSYFLESDDSQAKINLKVELAPLLEEYIAQGYVASFADAIKGHLQWIESL